MDLRFKSMLGTFNVDEAQGIVECFVAAVGNKDSVGDIVMPGAFTASLRRRKPRVVWGHDWNQPIGKVLDIYEVPASDNRLPAKMKAAGVGGLYARVQFNLKSERGREAFTSIVFFGEEQEWSIGYKTLDSIYSQERGANLLKEVELYEVSPVLHGANQLTATISIKSEKQDQQQIDSLRKSKWKTFDPAFAEMVRTKHPEIWAKGGNVKGNEQYRILAPLASKGGKASSETEINALALREAWVARHAQDYQLAGVVAQMKWLAVGSRGEAYMKDVIQQEIAKKGQKAGGSPDAKCLDPNIQAIATAIAAIMQGDSNPDDDDDDDLDPAGDTDQDFAGMLATLMDNASGIQSQMDDVLSSDGTDEEAKNAGSNPNIVRRVMKLPKGSDCGCGCGGAGTCTTKGKSLDMFDGAPMTDLVGKLNTLLSDVVTFYLMAHGFHWNVTGPDFSQYHALFDQINGDAYESIDPIAENMRKLGSMPLHNLTEFVGKRSISDASGLGDPHAMASTLLQANAGVLASLNDAFSAANASNEQGIANFLAERIDMHQKWKWFLSSSIKALPMGLPTSVIVENPLAVELSSLLADVYTMYFRAHGYHWNVTGQDFSQYHSLFEQIYEDLFDSVDPIAENIRKIGAISPFRVVDLIRMRTLEDTEVGSDPMSMVNDLLDANASILTSLNKVFDIATRVNEQGIANFIAERIDMHQKWGWFLRSSVQTQEIKTAIDYIQYKAGRVIAGRNMDRLRQALDLLRAVVEDGDNQMPQGQIQQKSAYEPVEYLVMDVNPESMFDVKSYLDDFSSYYDAEVVVDEDRGEWIAIEAKHDEMMNAVLDFFQPRQDDFQIKGFAYGESTDSIDFDDEVFGK